MEKYFYFDYIFINDLIYLLPEVYFIFMLLVLLVFGIIFDQFIVSLGKKVIEMLVDFGLLLLFMLLLLYLNSIDIQSFVGLFSLLKDEFVNNCLVFVTILCIVYFILLKSFIKNDTLLNYEYIILILLSFFGVLLLLMVSNFLVLYLVIELQTLCFYILVSFRQNNDFSIESGLKYFILGSFISGFLLFGISLFYGFTGILNFIDIYYYYLDYNNDTMGYLIVLISVFFIFTGLLFKVGSAPYHMWLLDVYSGVCYSILVFISIIPKIALFFLILKFYFVYFNVICTEYNYVFFYCCFLSVLIGTVGALYQTTIKRLLAYSAVSHVGYIFLGIISGNIEGLYGVVLYIVIYVLLMFNIFSILLSFRDYSSNSLLLNLNSLNTIYNSNKLLGFSLIFVLFSIGGVPPLVGFFSKLYIYFSILQEGYFLFVLSIILMSVVGIVYYLRLIKVVFFTKKNLYILSKKVDEFSSYFIVYFTILGILFVIYSKSLFLFIHNIILNFYF